VPDGFRTDLNTASGEHASERAGAAPDVEYGADLELLGQRHVHIEIAAVRIERVVDPSEPRIVEDGINHNAMRSSARPPSFEDEPVPHKTG
jgi:hypothetical protein